MTNGVDELDALRRRVLNVVGHALRTPVTTLCGMADELARTDDPVARSVLAEAVRRNGAIVESLLDDLLVAAGVSTVLPVAAPTAVGVVPAARQAWTTLGMPDELDIHGPFDAVAVAPHACVVTPLQRMLDNAVRYGRGPVRVDVRADDSHVAVDVVSHGGVPTAEELRHALEPFYRGEHAVMAAPGLGVGLAVAVALATHAGGGVTIASDGDDVVATLRLPATRLPASPLPAS